MGNRTEVITVRADKDTLQLSTVPRTFDVSAQTNGLSIVAHVYERPTRSWRFCRDTDVILPTPPEGTWRAIRGTATIELSRPGVQPKMPFAYRATIRLVGAEFVNSAGVHVKQTEPITLTAIVGWVEIGG
jgi:hypothetical protein